MRKKSIFRQMLIPMIAVIGLLAVIIITIFIAAYEKDIYARNQDVSNLLAGEIAVFMDGAYSVNAELADNPSILTMDTAIQTSVLSQCVARNTYLEQIYIQGTDGMQTGRSQGELADRSTRWWFIQMMSEKKPFISQSYYSVATGMPCASVFFPMYREEELVGIYAADMKLDFLQNLIGEYSHEEDGRISFVMDGEGVVVAHPHAIQIEEQYNYRDMTRTVSVKDAEGNTKKDKDGNIITEQIPLEASEEFGQMIGEVMEGNSGSRKISYEGELYYASYAPIPLKGDSDSWSLVTLHKKSAAMATVHAMLKAAALILAVGMGIVFWVMTVLVRRLTRSLSAVTGLIEEAAEGDFSIRAEEGNGNEVGLLAGSFNIMAGKISGILGRIMVSAKELAGCSGKLQKIEVNMEAVGALLKEIAAGTMEQTEDVGRVVEKMADMENNFKELKDRSGILLGEAEHAVSSGTEGEKSIRELKEQNRHVEHNVKLSYKRIKTLETYSEKIADIVGVISDISSETELLSLNASIEAARAGDAGRGFAVVAESIGKLAADSTSATRNIGKIIVELCKEIETTVFDIEKVKNSMVVQMKAAQKVEEIFESYKELAGQTGSSANTIDGLITEMYEIDHAIIGAVQRIRDVSENTEGLSAEVIASLEDELKNIRSEVCSLTEISEGLEQEMEKFKISG